MNKIQNRVKLIGHLGADPEIRTLESGRKVAIFRVATNSSYTNDKGERVEDTQWAPHSGMGQARRNQRKTPHKRQKSCYRRQVGTPYLRCQRR